MYDEKQEIETLKSIIKCGGRVQVKNNKTNQSHSANMNGIVLSVYQLLSVNTTIVWLTTIRI